MLQEIIKQTKTAFLVTALFTLLTGFIYPLVVTGFAHLFFPWQAQGSLIEQNGKLIGSLWIGQSFTGPNYFWGRPSATSPFPYNAANSSGSNQSPSNLNFLSQLKDRIAQLQSDMPQQNQLIPVDLVTASSSGLDPEISPLAAYYQVPRVAKARHLSEQEVQLLIQKSVKNRTLWLLGEPRVNVLELNIALDAIKTVGLKSPANKEL